MPAARRCQRCRLIEEYLSGINGWNEDKPLAGNAAESSTNIPGTWLFSYLDQIEQIGVISKVGQSRSVAPLLQPMNVDRSQMHGRMYRVLTIAYSTCLLKIQLNFFG